MLIFETKNTAQYLKSKGAGEFMGEHYKKSDQGIFESIRRLDNRTLEYVNGDGREAYLWTYQALGEREKKKHCFKGTCTITRAAGPYYIHDPVDADPEAFFENTKNLPFVSELERTNSYHSIFRRCVPHSAKGIEEPIKSCYRMDLVQEDSHLTLKYDVLGEKRSYDQTLMSCISNEYAASKRIFVDGDFRHEFYLGIDEDMPQPLMSPCCDPSLSKYKICNRDRYEMKNEWAYQNEENWVRY